MKVKKGWVLLVVFALLLSLITGCSGKKGSSKEEKDKDPPVTTKGMDSENGKETEERADTEQNAGAWSWPLPEKKELSVWLSWTNNYVQDPNDLIAIRQIEENTNVHVKWSTVTAQEQAEKFGLMMASGDYPDIIRGAEALYTGGLVAACTDGVIFDLTDLVEKYMPVYNSLRTSLEKLEKDTITDDGRIVGVYTIASEHGKISGEGVWDGMCVRQDWLEDLEMKAPVTIEDWYQMLTAFKESYNCEAPLLIGASSGYDMCNNFLTAYGVLGEFYHDNGTVKYGPLEDGYRQWVHLFHDWYAEGLIDPNFISNDAAFMGSADYIGTGRAGASPNIWGMTAQTYKEQGYTKDEDFFLAGVTTPVLNEGDTPQIGFATSELTKETLCITKNCRDTELACRWLDYWYTDECMMLDSLGIEGDSYVINEDGTFSMSEKIYDMLDSGEYPSMPQAVSIYTLGTSDFGLYNWGMFDVMNEKTSSRADEAYDAWNKSRFDLMLPPCMTMTETETTAFNNLYTAIKTLVQENTVKFISGTKPLSEYDAFVRELYGYGIEDCIRYKQAALDRYNAR